MTVEPTPFLAFATKGLEDVAAAEIAAAVPGAVVGTARDKVVPFTAPWVPALRELRTVDDLCVVAGETPDLASLDGVRAWLASGFDLGPALAAVGEVRETGDTFSVTVTAARSPAGSTRELVPVVTETVAARYGLTPAAPDTRAPLDVRLFADGRYAAVGVRAYGTPLGRRAYRTDAYLGALRPSVAAAMVRLACPAPAARTVWDPCCGSGTILAEAVRQGHDVAGSDVNPDAVRLTAETLGRLGVADPVVGPGDAADPRTWRAHAGVPDLVVVTNLPWGKQVPLAAAAALYATAGEALAALAAAGGRAVVLTVDPDRLVARVRRAYATAPVRTRRLGLLGQTPSLVLVG